MEKFNRCLSPSTLVFLALGCACSGDNASSAEPTATSTSSTSSAAASSDSESMPTSTPASTTQDESTGDPPTETVAKAPLLIQRVVSATDAVPLPKARVVLCPQGVPVTPTPVPLRPLTHPGAVASEPVDAPPCTIAFANEDGYALLEDLPPGHATLKVEAPGFLPQVDSIFIHEDQRVSEVRKLLPHTATFNFPSHDSAVLEHNGHSVTIAGNTLRDAATHARFDGQVEAIMTLYIPGLHPIESIPAPLLGKSVDNVVTDLASLGMLDMKFFGTDPDHPPRLLELDPEAPARVVFPLPAAANGLALGLTIPLWHNAQNAEAGPGGLVWEQEPESWRVAENPQKPGARIAVAEEVRRFSLINIDWPLTDPVCLKFIIKDKYTQQAIPDLLVLVEVSWQGGTSKQGGVTKVKDPVCLNIQKGSTVKYTVFSDKDILVQDTLTPDNYKSTPALCPQDWEKWCAYKCYDSNSPTCVWCNSAAWMKLDDSECNILELTVSAPTECQNGSYQTCLAPDECLGEPGVGVCSEGRRYCLGGKWDQDACLGPKNGWVCAANEPKMDEELCGPYESGKFAADDDCDSTIDDGCDNGCANGATKQCYAFSESTRDVGECKGGLAACIWDQNLNQGTWPEDDPNTPNIDESCPDQVGPKPEDCYNGKDDNCDKIVDCQGTPIYKYGAGDDTFNHTASAVAIYPQSSEAVFAVDLYNPAMATVFYGVNGCVVQPDPDPTKRGVLLVKLDFNSASMNCQSRGVIRTHGDSLETRDIVATSEGGSAHSYLLAVGNGTILASNVCPPVNLASSGLLLQKSNEKQVCENRKALLAGPGDRNAFDTALNGDHIWITATSSKQVAANCTILGADATAKDGVVARYTLDSGCTYALSLTGGSGERRLRSIATTYYMDTEYVAVFGDFDGTLNLGGDILLAKSASTPVLILYAHKNGALQYMAHRLFNQPDPASTANGAQLAFAYANGAPQIIVMGDFKHDLDLNYPSNPADPLDPGPVLVSAPGDADLFVASYGLDLKYKDSFVPVSDLTEQPRFLLPGDGNVIIGGDFLGAELDFNGFKATNTSPGTYDTFAMKLRIPDNEIPTFKPQWVRSYGGSSFDQARDADITPQGISMFVGTFSDKVSIKIGDKDPPQVHQAGATRDSFMVVTSP